LTHIGAGIGILSLLWHSSTRLRDLSDYVADWWCIGALNHSN